MSCWRTCCPKATVIHADGSNRYVLDSEGLARTDAVVTLTDMDEENLIISMYANYLGTCKVITKINRTDFTEVLSDKGIDCVVSPKELCCNDIVRYVRAMGNRKGESVITLHRIVGDRVEALEFPGRAAALPAGEAPGGRAPEAQHPHRLHQPPGEDDPPQGQRHHRGRGLGDRGGPLRPGHR